MATHSSTLAWKIPWWKSLVGCSPWGLEELDTTEWLHFHFSLPCIGEGNGNPLQCSCLENSRDSGAWWAAVYGVTRSRARLKQLSSGSSSSRAFQRLYTASLTASDTLNTWSDESYSSSGKVDCRLDGRLDSLQSLFLFWALLKTSSFLDHSENNLGSIPKWEMCSLQI